MTKTKNRLDAFGAGIAHWVIKLRWLVILIAIALTAYVGQNAANLEFSTNFRAFFSKENPELKAFEDLQATYTKTDNFFLVFEPRDGSSAFTNETLAAVEFATEEAWLIPYTLRVDSLSNFQHTYAIGDDLIVEDLITDAANLSPEELSEKREIALSEPLLRNQIVTADGGVTAVNVTLQYPEQSLCKLPTIAQPAVVYK